MGTVVFVLTNIALFFLAAFLSAVTVHALGLTWKGLLHWIGELLLIIGIILAAKGISDVRGEWTQLPGFWGTVKQRLQAARTRIASFLWLWWNRAIERWPRLAKRLRMHIHKTLKHLTDSGTGLDKLSFGGTGTVDWGPPPEAGTTEERLAWLEARMTEAGEQLRNLHTRHWEEAQAREDVAARERSEREADDRRIRDSIANLAGGGLKLQAWGVRASSWALS